MPKDAAGLTPKQRRFVEEYLIDRNGLQAAIRAGYSKNAAQEIAYENLRKPQIAAEIKKRETKIQEETAIDQVWVRKRLKLISDVNSEMIDVPMGGETNCIINKKMRDAAAANRATELLGKDQGMFTDKIEVTGKDGKDLIPVDERKKKAAREIAFILAAANRTKKS